MIKLSSTPPTPSTVIPTTGINPIATDQTAEPTKDKVVKSILQKSFLPHQKGKLREYCSFGHVLELPIMSSFAKELLRPDRTHPHYRRKVVSVFTAGLVEKKCEPWVKDSIDFLAVVKNVFTDEKEVWGVEIKSRVTTSSAAREEEYGIEIERDKHEIINFKQAYRYLPILSERYQILHHHAYTYNLE